MENQENKGIFVRVYEWFKNLTVKGLLGAIFVAFIIIVILMSVSYLPAALSRVSSSLSGALYSIFVPAEGATMTVDKKIINSGDSFTVNFKNGDTTNGLFTVSYDCSQNITLMAVETNGLKNIECNKPYYLLSNSSSLKIQASTAENLVRLAITGSLENNDTQKSEVVGVARVTVTNSAAGVVVNPPVATTTNNGSNQSSGIPNPTYVQPPANNPTYYGKPDLAIRVLQVGLLNTYSNTITPQTQFSYSDTVGVKFEVRNDGDAATGMWNFSAVLPSASTPIYTSPTQVSLQPGQSIQFTLGFNGLTGQYNSVITINVDPSNMVSESNESNNTLTTTVINTGYNNNYGNNYNNNYNNNGCYVNGYFTYNCANNGYYNNNNYNGVLGVSCYGTPNNPSTGDRVYWYGNVTGGNGNYYYTWSGTDGLSSSSQNPSKTYSSNGIKYATVTVSSGGTSVSQTCSVNVGNNGYNANSNVDLAVNIIAVGRISSSGSFIEDSTINYGDDAAVQFRVINNGAQNSGYWGYSTNLSPAFSGSPYVRNNMSSLSPGQSTTVTVTFNNISRSGTNTFFVEVDPDDVIGDSYRSNNTDTSTIYVN